MKEDIIRLLNAAKQKESKSLVEIKLSPKEFRALQTLKECKQFQALDAAELDRHSVRYYLNALTSLTVNEGEILSKKVEKMAASGKLDLRMKTLNESMADDLAADHEGEEHGMYGLDKGPKTPSGDADKGSDQKDDRGDNAAPKDKGYLDEEEGGPPPEIKAKIDAKNGEEKPEVKEGDGDEEAINAPADKGVAEDEGPNYDATSPPIDAKEADKPSGEEKELGAEMDKVEARIDAINKKIARFTEARKNGKLSESNSATRKELKETRRGLKEQRRDLKEKIRALKEARRAIHESKENPLASKIRSLKEKRRTLKEAYRQLKAKARVVESKELNERIAAIKSLFGKVNEEISSLREDEVPKDAESPDDKQTAAKDAKYKDGAMQNEAEGQDYAPKAKDPGEPSGSKGGEKPDPEKLGDVEDLPDYSAKAVKAEDPSHSDLNKGPAKVGPFESIESKIVGMLEKGGFTPGTPEWENLYSKGFARAISERAKFLSKKLNEVRVPRKAKK
jgi:hypothetical protein